VPGRDTGCPPAGQADVSAETSFIDGNENEGKFIMIGYVTIGTNDLVRAAAFYDALLGELGAKRMMETDQFIAWSVRPEAPGLGVSKPFDKKPATVGNGVMVALEASSKAQVDALYRKALQLGGKDEGPPGPRGDSGFYAGYFRDLDGNKLNFFHFG
jgi:catechol 2,3-dioxygenase-like lactoylglutathione lyase family enzyme